MRTTDGENGVSLEALLPAHRLEVLSSGEGLSVSFERCLRRNAVLRARRPELERVLLRLSGRVAAASVLPGGTALRIERCPELPAMLEAAAKHIAAIAARPCKPASVVELLGIRSIELVRWTQDGRLKVTGSTAIRRGSRETCPIYDAAHIATLAASPAVIESWRYQDARERSSSPASRSAISSC